MQRKLPFMRYYAIKLSSKWVEIRRSRVPLKPIHSRVEKPFEEEERKVTYDMSGRPKIVAVKVKKNFVIDITYFEGGKHLKTVSMNDYITFAGANGVGMPTKSATVELPRLAARAEYGG